MITPERLADMVEDEIVDAMKYLKCAMACKDESPDLAEMFLKLSDEEMQHMQRLYDKLRVMYKGA